jgi:hypothetical protein
LLVPMYEKEPAAVWRTFPDWAGVGTDRRLEAYEKRLQDLEVIVRTLQRRLRDRDSVVRDLRALYGGSRPVKILRELRRRAKRR